MRIVDLSVAIENASESEEIPARIKYISHRKGGTLLGLGVLWNGKSFFEKLFHFINGFVKRKRISSKDFPDSEALATEKITLSTHTGTHIDSPYHYGKNNRSIEEIPLDFFYSDGVMLDFSSRKSMEPLKKVEIIEKLDDIGYKLKPNDIVLICTGAYQYYGKREYKTDYFGLSVESLQFLLEKGIKLIGTDAFGLDQPFEYMERKFNQTKQKQYLWPTHLYGKKHPYMMIEKLSNLLKIGRFYNFKVAAFPIKIEGASAGWSRVVAIIYEEKESD